MAEQGACPRLSLIGDGPLAGQVRQAAQRNPAIRWLGPLAHPETLQAIGVLVQGDVVFVRRAGAADVDVLALAQALRRVRGVNEVILTND